MPRSKISLGITGGVGSGKSFVCRLLEKRGVPVFYTDIEAKAEMKENQQVRHELSLLLGHDVVSPSGQLEKSLIRRFMNAAAGNVERVNAIVHPRVGQRFLRWEERQDAPVVAVESALLFESGLCRLVDKAIVVTAPRDVRLERVMRRDGVGRQDVLKLMSWQTSDEAKASKADFVINNDGIAPIEEQVDAILNEICRQGAA